MLEHLPTFIFDKINLLTVKNIKGNEINYEE